MGRGGGRKIREGFHGISRWTLSRARTLTTSTTDRKSWRTAISLSLSLSLFEGIPARRFRFGWERMERVIVSFWWKKDKRVWLILSVLRAFELKFQGWMSSRLKSTSEERKVLENMWLMRRIFLFFFFLFLRTSPWFIDERSLLNFNTNLDVKEEGKG